MSNFAPYSNYGYVSLIKETTAGTAVTPTGFLRILSESVVPNFNVSMVQEVAGDRERNIRNVPNQIDVSGDIVFYVESKMIGHFLRSLFGAPTSQTLTASAAYRHVFEVTTTPKTYTIDIKPADSPWAHRYFGVQITKLAFDADENRIKCTASIMPRKAFINAKVTTAANSGTALAVDQTAGLTTSDTIIVLDKADGFTTIAEFTIAAVVSDTALTVSTIATQLDVGDIVVIKKATASYTQDTIFTLLGGSQVYVGDDIDNLTASDKEGFSLEYNNEVEARFFAGLEESARYSGDVLTKGYSAKGTLSRFYDSELNIAKLRKNTKFGMRILMQGETALEANVAAKAKTTYGTGTGFYIEAETAGKAGNDINVTFVINSIDTLAASISGNNVLISLASTTASKNTGTLIAAAVNALATVAAVAVSTGAEQFTAAIDNHNLGFYSGAAANVVGRDASEKPYLQFDHAAAKLDPYFVNNSEDSILQEELPMTFYKDVESGSQSKKWSTRVFLVNSISSY